MKKLLQVKNVSAGYGEQEIVHNVSFDLLSGTMTGILGPNGCGKTTLIRCVINQLRHTGTCSLLDEPLERLSQKQLSGRVSYIAQRSGISISLPVLDVVLMGFNPVLKLLEFPNSAQKARARAALRTVGLENCINCDFQTLSEGQKQLVLLARTMVEDTNLLVLDEPDSALDFSNRYQMLSLIKKMVQTRDKAGLLCLHDPGLALEFCEQILLMKEGRIIHTLLPKTDGLQEMQEALAAVYDNVTLAECFDRHGKRHLTLLWEGEL